MRTLPIGLSYLFSAEGASQWGLIMAATIFVILPVLLLFLRWQKHIVSGLTSGATKG
jgi:sn-glycerol 3-phosphate transport system permease protein